MKIAFLLFNTLWFLTLATLAQPLTSSGTLAAIDFDANGTIEVEYNVSATKTGEIPENWQVGFGIVPEGKTRMVRPSTTRIQFHTGEKIDSSRLALTNYLPNPPREPTESYSIGILYYRAMRIGDWIYSTRVVAFEGESEVLLGVRFPLLYGPHYGWIRLARPLADSHTQFDLVDYAFHPLTGAPIAAGEPPMLPPITTQRTPEGLTFMWDARWGAFMLETTTNLVPPMSWEVIAREALPPLTIPTGDKQRLFRLRLP